MEVTGVIEDEKSVWMHPFRSNQYNFTEVAPFPEVRFPLQVGATWSSKLTVYEGWGKWENSTIEDSHRIMGKENITVPFGELETWQVSSEASAPFGTSTQKVWFHEELGFVKIVIHNYQGQTLEIALAQVTD